MGPEERAKVAAAEWANMPRWRKELHAWISGRHEARVTLPDKVSPELSLLRKRISYGLEGLFKRAQEG